MHFVSKVMKDWKKREASEAALISLTRRNARTKDQAAKAVCFLYAACELEISDTTDNRIEKVSLGEFIDRVESAADLDIKKAQFKKQVVVLEERMRLDTNSGILQFVLSLRPFLPNLKAAATSASFFLSTSTSRYHRVFHSHNFCTYFNVIQTAPRVTTFS